MARRAASICRAVIRPRPTALSPYSPKLTLLPRSARPRLRPFIALRNFVLFGCNIIPTLIGCRLARRFCLLAGADHFALEDPNLDADHAVGCLRLVGRVINVSAQRVQGNPALAIPL